MTTGEQGRAAFFQVDVPYSAEVSTGFICIPLGTELSVRGSVLDPRGDEVPSQWSMHASKLGFAVVTFTPRIAGPHHFAARFEPNVGLVQGTFYPGVRSTRPPAGELKLPSSLSGYCSGAHLMPSGHLACATDISTISTIIDGGVASSTVNSSGPAIFSGPVLWVQPVRGTYERWLDSPAGYVLTHTFTSVVNSTLIAGTEDTVFASGAGATRFDAMPDGGVTQTELGYAVFDSFAAGGMSSDAGAFWSLSTQSCLNSLDGVTQQCFTGGTGNRVDRGEVWSANTPFTGGPTLELLREDGGLVSGPMPNHELGTLPLTWANDTVRDMSLAIPIDGGFVHETFDEKYVSGAVDGDWIILFETDKAVLFAR